MSDKQKRSLTPLRLRKRTTTDIACIGLSFAIILGIIFGFAGQKTPTTKASDGLLLVKYTTHE
jgi:hypothetical protein